MLVQATPTWRRMLLVGSGAIALCSSCSLQREETLGVIVYKFLLVVHARLARRGILLT